MRKFPKGRLSPGCVIQTFQRGRKLKDDNSHRRKRRNRVHRLSTWIRLSLSLVTGFRHSSTTAGRQQWFISSHRESSRDMRNSKGSRSQHESSPLSAKRAKAPNARFTSSGLLSAFFRSIACTDISTHKFCWMVLTKGVSTKFKRARLNQSHKLEDLEQDEGG